MEREVEIINSFLSSVFEHRQLKPRLNVRLSYLWQLRYTVFTYTISPFTVPCSVELQHRFKVSTVLEQSTWCSTSPSLKIFVGKNEGKDSVSHSSKSTLEEMQGFTSAECTHALAHSHKIIAKHDLTGWSLP